MNIAIRSMLSKIRILLVRHTYLLLFVPLIIVAYPISGPGIILGGDFPALDTGEYSYDKLWTWLEKGGYSNYEGITRFPITSLWHILNLVNIDATIASKIMILMGFTLASFSFYFSFLLFFRAKLITGIFSENNFSLKLAAILGSLFFAYNIWSILRIAHWHLWIGYSLMPLFFVSTYLSFKSPKNLKYILCSVFLWAFASMTPHMMVFYGIMFTAIFLFFLFRILVTKQRKRVQIQILLPFVTILLLYVLVNLYWIYPYALGSYSRTITPDYVVVIETIETLSRDNSFSNTFRIVADWLGSLNQFKSTSSPFLYSSWIVVTFAIPIFAFLSLILSRGLLKYTLVFSAVAIIGILIAMGTNSPFDYYKLLLGIPMLGNYIWIFRDPAKWFFLIAFSYSFLIGIGSYAILQRIKSTRKFNSANKAVLGGLFMVLLVVCICVYSFPAFELNMLNRYKPIILPSEFDRLNGYLSKIDTDRVYFIPYPLATTNWSKISDVGHIYQLDSVKPSIESTNTETRNYYNFLVNSITENRSKHVDDLIYPLGTSYLIFHNDTWDVGDNNYDLEDIELLNHIYSLEGIKNIQKIGFHNLFRVGNETGEQINLFKQNNVALGGLGILNTLNSFQDFSAINSSILFVDHTFRNDSRRYIENSDVVVTQKGSLDDLIYSYAEDNYIISPFDTIHNHNPPRMWSKAGATDPLHGGFHPDLEELGIDNREFDFGKGLVMTSSAGTNISIPLEVSADDQYYLVMRLLENSKGGKLNVYLDSKLIDTVDTFNIRLNNFVWKTITDNTLHLEKGRHTITLENDIGLNVVNVIGLIPIESMDKVIQKADQTIKTQTFIYLLEAESSFYNNRGTVIGDVHSLFEGDSKSNISTKTSGHKAIIGQFKVPPKADLMSLKLLGKQNLYTNWIPNAEVFPAAERVDLVTMDFEREKGSVSLAALRHSKWMNQDDDALVISTEKNNPISGNNSMRVDITQSESTGWNIISTDFIPINDIGYYSHGMDIRAKDLHNFHVRILYYDQDKERIGDEVVYRPEDDSFTNGFSTSILPPKGSKFLKSQILVASDSKAGGNYIIDNVKLEEIIPNRSFLIDFDNIENEPGKYVGVMDANSSSLPEMQLINNSSILDYKVMQSNPIPVKENQIYNYSLDIQSKDADNLTGFVTFSSSDDVIESSTKYGVEASQGRVLSLSPGSEVYSELEILKPANYTIAIRASTCESCTFLNVSIHNETENNNDYDNDYDAMIKTSNISLIESNNKSKLKWMYLDNIYLSKGKYNIKIYSDSHSDLDVLTMYSSDDNTNFRSQQYQPLENIFDSTKMLPPAYTAEYKKINPTKYVLEVKNATRPYTLSFAESYDPLWVAYTYTDNKESGNNNFDFKTNSIPLYSFVNGFYVNKTGDYSLTIEYEPQKWFFIGGTISSIAVILILAVLTGHILIKKRRRRSCSSQNSF